MFRVIFAVGHQNQQNGCWQMFIYGQNDDECTQVIITWNFNGKYFLLTLDSQLAQQPLQMGEWSKLWGQYSVNLVFCFQKWGKSVKTYQNHSYPLFLVYFCHFYGNWKSVESSWWIVFVLELKLFSSMKTNDSIFDLVELLCFLTMISIHTLFHKSICLDFVVFQPNRNNKRKTKSINSVDVIVLFGMQLELFRDSDDCLISRLSFSLICWWFGSTYRSKKLWKHIELSFAFNFLTRDLIRCQNEFDLIEIRMLSFDQISDHFIQTNWQLMNPSNFNRYSFWKIT